MAEIVTLTPSGDPVQWTMCHNGQCGGSADGTPYPEIVVPKDAKNTLMIFTISDGNGIAFRKAAKPYDPSEAFYVEPGKGKNPKKGIDSKGEFENLTLANGQTLVFNNKNSKADVFSYKLHFEPLNGKEVTSIDPDIRNNGGGSGMDGPAPAYSSVGIAIAAAVAFVLIAFLVGRAMGKKA